jgi:hypothetical protein
MSSLGPLLASIVEPTFDVIDVVANMPSDSDASGSLTAAAPSVDRGERNGKVRRKILGAEQRSACRKTAP